MKDKKSIRIENKRLRKRLSQRSRLIPSDIITDDYVERSGGCVVQLILISSFIVYLICQ